MRPQEAPVYSGLSIVNAADNHVEPLAPNTIASMYGKNLAYATQSLTANEASNGILPTVLPGTGVHILVGGIPANLYYVSPGQINFLIPVNLLPGPINLQLVIDGLAGPLVPLQLAAAAPALFQLDLQYAVATHADGSVITHSAPAKPGEVVVLYATGLGQTTPPLAYCELPASAAWLEHATDFQLLVDGLAVDSHAVLYAGIAPGFAGLYQINVMLPASSGPDPEIRIGLGDSLSIPGVHLPVQP
jgi:uncharacterized protein (TIGR03437 family)